MIVDGIVAALREEMDCEVRMKCDAAAGGVCKVRHHQIGGLESI
jgi:hypothetical protein